MVSVPPPRRSLLSFGWIIPVLGLLVLLVAFVWKPWVDRRPIVVGILHSQTGPLATSERAVIDAVVLALEQVNARGGLLGREVKWVIADGKSDEAVFASEAQRLITEEKVSALFGCWTSASRKAVKPVVEQSNHLLLYPVQYEGCEVSPNIVYLGAAPNQQIVPALAWSQERVGRKVYIVGSDYVFPRVAGEIIRRQVTALDGEVVGETYLPLGSKDVAAAIASIRAARPDVILNTINGDTNVAFFEALQREGRDGARIPVISFSIAENELQEIGNLSALEGHYAVWNYFQSIERPENAAFIAAFRARFGESRVVSDPMEAAYCGALLWARAVTEAGTEAVDEVRTRLRGQSLNAPEGVVTIDPATQHLWKTVRVGKIGRDGQFEIVWDSRYPIRPVPYPISQPPSAWATLIDTLFRGWGGRWSRPTS